MLLILSENWTLVDARNLPELVRWARLAEDAGFDSVMMLSEHVVLGPDAGERGMMANPRAYAGPGNQNPATPWPNSLMLLSAIAAVTGRVRLVASAVLAPLRHPLLLARELGTWDLLSQGRLVVQPGVSWSRDEYAALGVPFVKRGKILDEQLAVLELVWRSSPASFEGQFFRFADVISSQRPSAPRGRDFGSVASVYAGRSSIASCATGTASIPSAYPRKMSSSSSPLHSRRRDGTRTRSRESVGPGRSFPTTTAALTSALRWHPSPSSSSRALRPSASNPRSSSTIPLTCRDSSTRSSAERSPSPPADQWGSAGIESRNALGNSRSNAFSSRLPRT